MLSSAAFESIDESAGTDSTRVWAAEEEYARREGLPFSATTTSVAKKPCL